MTADAGDTELASSVPTQSNGVLVLRSEIVDGIRRFFKEREYLEVETPIVTEHPGMEPHLDYFQTDYVSKDGGTRVPMFLNHSPELFMKKLLGRGYGRVFQMGKVFRNGEGSSVYGEHPRDEHASLYHLHHPEFTMLEWYRAGEDYTFMMRETEELCRFLVSSIDSLDTKMCSLIDQAWEKLSVREAFLRWVGIDLEQHRNADSLRLALGKLELTQGVHVPASSAWTFDDCFFWVMLNKVEPHLGKEKPVILYDYPSSQAALARRRADDDFWSERFEVYIDGVELCNAFSELCDPLEQRSRLLAEQKERRKMKKPVPEIDEEFLRSLEHIESATGNALGVDRLVMLLLGKRDIRHVMLV